MVQSISGTAQTGNQGGGNLVQRQHLVCRTMRDRFARHAEHNAAGLVLHIVVAARILISRIATAPSLPMPVSMIPNALRPTTAAADLNSTSTEGLWRLTGAPSSTTAT